jgi:hypothetical protein
MHQEILRLVASCSLMLAAVAVAVGPDVADAASGVRRGAARDAKQPHFAEADRAIFEQLLAKVREAPAERPGDRLAVAGLALTGTPYVAGSLERPGPERLVCNLRGLDCVTFVEVCLALSRVAGDPAATFESFLAELARQRYRDGRPDGYASRLHYYSEWIRHNALRGAIRDITAELGGKPDDRRIHFMTANRQLYPRLKDHAVFAQMKAVEATLESRQLVAVPRDEVAAVVGKLQNGDILAFVPTIEGLDISHTGLAHRASDGQIHLLHAPDVGEAVRINPEPLARYVATHKKVHGLVVARPL